MSWVVYKLSDRTGVELDALLDPQALTGVNLVPMREGGE